MIASQHPAAGELARFAVADGERSEDVRQHLESGCGICLMAVRRLREIAALSEKETEPVAGDWVVPRRIVFHQGGARNEALADVQILCGTGPYDLDVLVRETPGPARTLDIAGQVTRRGGVFDPVAELPLFLVEAGTHRDLARTVTDEFGEFDLQSPLAGTLGLRLGADSGAPCVLLWGGDAT